MWLWTSWLVLLSVLTWRFGWYCVDAYILRTPDVLHAISLAIVGMCFLVAAGRFRTASAPPVGIADDNHAAGFLFPAAIFSGSKLTGVLLDLALTVPVVFVWAGYWMVSDLVHEELSVPPLAS